MLVVLTTSLNRLGVCWSSRPNQHLRASILTYREDTPYTARISHHEVSRVRGADTLLTTIREEICCERCGLTTRVVIQCRPTTTLYNLIGTNARPLQPIR